MTHSFYLSGSGEYRDLITSKIGITEGTACSRKMGWDGMGWGRKKSSSIETLFFFIRRLDAKFIPDKDTCTGLRHGGQTEKVETLIKKN